MLSRVFAQGKKGGLDAIRLYNRESGKKKPKQMTRSQRLAATEPLIARIAAGDLPYDETTADILRDHAEEQERALSHMHETEDED